MAIKGLHLFYLIVGVRLISGESLYYKLPKDHDPSKEIRGNSFGLENFLLQAYKEADSLNTNEDLPAKRIRGKETHKKSEPVNIRGQTFGLENLAPNLYNLGHPSLGLSEYLDIRPVTEPKPVHQKRRIPEAQIQKNNDDDDRRERNKIRKPVKQVVRRPVTSTAAPNASTMRIAQNADLRNKEPTEKPDQKFVVSEAATPVTEVSYDVPKFQEADTSDKDIDQATKQRPRKRVTMRRRRKRPTQASQDVDITAQPSESKTANDLKETYEDQRDVEYAAVPQTTLSAIITTTTIRARTDKERPNRRKPGGFRKVPIEDTDQTLETISKVESTTPEYHHDSDSSETVAVTTYATEIKEYSEESFVKPITVSTTTLRSTSSEETSAADLKTILKQQSGPLSLSELLQTQNLSLADFLKNRKEAALLLSGKKGIQSTTARTDSRERGRPSNFNTKGRPFTKNRQETDTEETRSSERNRIIEPTTLSTDRYTYNGFVPKNPRVRTGHFKGVYPTVKSNFASEEKASDERKTVQGQERSDSQVENSTNSVETIQTSIRPRLHLKNLPKRFNDVRLKLRIHRRKYNPHSTTSGIEKEDKTEASTLSTTTVSTSQAIQEKPSSTEEIPTTRRIGLRIPFKSSNNPELSLILPNRNKSEEKNEKRERNSNYSSRLHSFKKSSQEKDDSRSTESNDVEPTTTARSAEKLKNKDKLPLDVIDMDDEKEILKEESPEKANEEKEKSKPTRVEAVGKIPSSSELQKYESKDEILELLKPGSHSERLQRILESRNMTVKELLENREKSSLQSNFTQFFSENDVGLKKKNEITTTTATNPDKVFQSLPDFQPIHKNLFHKNVKEVKSNSYPDSQVEESRAVSSRARANATSSEPRGSKQLGAVVEVKKKLQLNSDSEGRDSFESNDGLLDRWNRKDRVFLYNNAFQNIKQQPPRTDNEKYSINDNTDNEVPESDIILLETLKRNQEANQKLKSNINEILQEQSEVRDVSNDIDKSFIPPAVKSAIIASGVVMGLALFVFVAIFAACGWKQRQIRLRARSSILNDALANSDSEKKVQRTSALSPANFKQSSVYKKSLEMDEDSTSGGSLSSNASSYLWNTLKNTFAGRNTTLKNRLEKEDKIREERLEGLKSVLRSHETRRSDLLVQEDANEETFSNALRRQEERYSVRKNDGVKRSPSFASGNHFSSCTHGH